MKKSLLLVFLLVGCHDPFYVPPLSTATSSIVESSSINKVSTLNNELLHSEYLYYQGRHLYNNNKKIETIYHTSSGIELSFMGSSLSIQFDIVGSGDVYLRVALDEEILPDGQRIKVNQNNLSHNLFSNLDNSEHHITLLKESESTHGLLSLKSITTDGYFLPYQSKDRLKFLCLGASGISGHGALGSQGQGWSSNNSSSLYSFGYLSARMYQAEVQFVAQSGWGVKWGYNNKSGNVNIRKALDFIGIDQNNNIIDIPFDIEQYQANFIIVNMGGNDYSSYVNTLSGNAKTEAINLFKESVAETCSYLLNKLPQAKIIWTYTSGASNGAAAVSAFSTLPINLQTRIFPTIIKQVGEDGDPEGADSHCSYVSHLKSAQNIADKIKEKTGIEQLIDNYVI